MNQPLFSWLHLSDIHFGDPLASDRAKKELLLTGLLQALPRALSEGVPRPDVVLVTGDIAFSGAARDEGEYTRAGAWLDEVVAQLGRTRRDVFLVPGNHDVQRVAKADKGRLKRLRDVREGKQPLDDALNKPSSHDELLARLAPYRSFARQYAPDTLPSEERLQAGALDWSHLRVQGGLRIRLFGLNSALLANDVDAKERGRLRLGHKQLLELTRSERHKEVVLVLTHHPVDYLGDAHIHHHLLHRAHLHLFGHIHDPGSLSLRSGEGQETVRIVAGAVHASAHEGPTEFGFSFGAIVPGARPEELRLRIWSWKYMEKQGGFHLDRNCVPGGAEYAEHSLGHVSYTPPSTLDVDGLVEVARWLREACAPAYLEDVLARAQRLGATGNQLEHARRKDWAVLLCKINETPGGVEALLRGIRLEPHMG